MIQPLVGALFLLCPYMLVVLFQDRLRGFIYVSAFGLAFHLILALVSQSLHMFTYPLVLVGNGLVVSAIAVILISRRRNIQLTRPGWPILVPLFAFALSGFELWSIHYDYTGTVDSAGGIQTVAHDPYGYPMFSDEWVDAALDRSSIESASLPLTNPLVPGASYTNLLAPFNALSAELFLLLGLDPVSSYGALAAGFGLSICLALYILMRKLGVGSLATSIAVLCAPLIAESGNLPGIWFLLPYIPGTLALILMLSALAMRERSLSIVAGALSLALYPPMAVFAIPAACASLWHERRARRLQQI